MLFLATGSFTNASADKAHAGIFVLKNRFKATPTSTAIKAPGTYLKKAYFFNIGISQNKIIPIEILAMMMDPIW